LAARTDGAGSALTEGGGGNDGSDPGQGQQLQHPVP
jgi:hypothetical protein